MEEKTNVMRLLDKEKINYKAHYYNNTEAISGMEVTSVLNQDPHKVFKTLVTVAKSNEHYVFVVPVNCELDLKKAAKAVNEKNLEMLKQKDLLPLTGYIHGGCSPIGMKKKFKTVFDITASSFDTIMFSAGKIGYQVELNVFDIKNLVEYKLEDIISD
ncbi:MAG: Cys-tRNA(Pro) deacylase [Clostridia bacterium]|nr:Cys-tRNA(Pro) deacylase [Clostridia bacterium]